MPDMKCTSAGLMTLDTAPGGAGAALGDVDGAPRPLDALQAARAQSTRGIPRGKYVGRIMGPREGRSFDSRTYGARAPLTSTPKPRGVPGYCRRSGHGNIISVSPPACVAPLQPCVPPMKQTSLLLPI